MADRDFGADQEAVFRSVPAIQCIVCGLPLTGALGAFLSMIGIGRSTRNPNCCTRCNTHIEEGRLVEVTMVFADLSGFTALTRRLGPDSAYEVVDRYLRGAAEILTSQGGFIDKFIGDAVMSFFNVPVKRTDHRAAAVAAALELHRGMPALSKKLGVELNVTVGVASGWARVGRLGSDDVKDYTAIGDVVNQAARLQAQALPGETVVSEEVYREVAARFPRLQPETLTLKGFSESAIAYRLGSVAGPEPGTIAPRLTGAKPLGLSAFVMALIGAACLGKIFVGSVLLALSSGLGVLLLGLAVRLDGSPLRLPLLAAASVAAAASLALALRERQEREAASKRNGCIVPSPRERRRNCLVFGASVLSLVFVGLELALHYAHYRHL